MKFYRLSGAIFYDLINTIHVYLFIKPFLDNKMSIFEEYGALIFLACKYSISGMDDVITSKP